MVNYYETPAGEAKTWAILQMLVYMSTGFFVADLISSAPFDYAIISGKREHRWMHLFYFGAKLSMLAFLTVVWAAIWFKDQVDCQSVMNGIEFLMGMAVIFSSILLSFRTIVVNNINGTKLPVKAILIVAGLGLLTSWCYGVVDVTAVWIPEAATPYNNGVCVATSIKDTYFVKYIVTIFFDFLVLALAIRGILLLNSRSRFGDILMKQGIIYFVLSLIANVTITVLTLLKLSPVMSLILAVPQSTICIIASTRLYSQLAMEGTNTTHVPSTQRRSSFHDSDISNKKAIDTVMTMEEGLQIEIHTVTEVTY